ncbi:MAG TPA: hypothetical protein VGG10_22635 [Rhizomicrobium sp.]|jgi:uncharacterized BrkB/YihY/UPF0761 family membrane protein
MTEFLDWISHHSPHLPSARAVGEGLEAGAESGIDAALDNAHAKKKADQSFLGSIENQEITVLGAAALMISGVIFGPMILGLLVRSPLKLFSNIHYVILFWVAASILIFAPIFSVWGLQRLYKFIPNARVRAWVRGLVALIVFLGTIALLRMIFTYLGLSQGIQRLELFG